VNVVDSSAWLEYFGDGECATEFAVAIESPDKLIVPTLTLSAELALEAARLSVDTSLAMADSIILATARAYDATLWTQDAHFEGMNGVQFRVKTGSGQMVSTQTGRSGDVA